MRKAMLSFVLMMVATSWAFAQAAPPVSAPDVLEKAWRVEFSGNYSLLRENSNNNGYQAGFALRVAQHWAARADVFTVTSPSARVTIAGPEYRFSLGHWFKGSQFIHADGLEAAFSAKIGSARSGPNFGVAKARFAYGLGGSLDKKVSDHLSLRILELNYVRASIFRPEGLVLGNHLQLASGIGLRF